MFLQYTMKDWKEAKQPLTFLQACISAYKGSDDFKQAMVAEGYYTGEHTAIDSKVILEKKKITQKTESGDKVGLIDNDVVGNRISSNFFKIFVVQENSFLLGNGITLKDAAMKEKLGRGFDKTLAEMGKKALIQRVCYGYWNVDHMEQINAYTDGLSGAFPLLDEKTSEIGIFIQFWQLSDKHPMYVRLFESDGITVFIENENGQLVEDEAKRSYVLNVSESALGISVEGRNYGVVPVIPLYGNADHRSELTTTLKRKIDAYNVITSDFADNLERANEVYWVLNNFGGTIDDIIEMMEIIKKLGVVANQQNGVGGGQTAEPKTIEVPYQARQTALALLKKELYRDAMALDMDEMTGGSLTNVAIKVAMTNLNLKCDDFEWQVFDFVQKLLALQGIDTEEIRFKRRTLVNDKEMVETIMAMRSDIDLDTALKLNPLIEQDDIETIKANLDAERVSGMPSIEELQSKIDQMNEETEE